MAPRNPNEQTEPIEDGSGDASREARIDGIVEQVRQDLVLGHADGAHSVLRERLENALISVNDDEFAALVERLSQR